MTSVVRGAATPAAAFDGPTAPGDGPGASPIEGPGGVGTAPARAFIVAAAAEFPLPSVLAGLGFPDEVMLTGRVVQASDTGPSNGSARSPKPEAMLIRSS